MGGEIVITFVCLYFQSSDPKVKLGNAANLCSISMDKLGLETAQTVTITECELTKHVVRTFDRQRKTRLS